MNKPLKYRDMARPSAALIKFPKRPDLSVLSEIIPLFYVGRNKHGLWVARDADGHRGGLFFRRQSAVRFAQQECGGAGCATMILAEPLELDVENQGSAVAELFVAAIESVSRKAPLFARFVGTAIAEWHKLVAEISRALAGERRHRAAIERELFHGQIRLSSKDDDDLPIP